MAKKEKKLSKKASAKVWGVAAKFRPNLSKNTSYDEAWEIIATEGELEGDIEANKYGMTQFTLYRGEEVLHVYDLGVVFRDGDWDWTTIYKTVCEDVVARRLYKKPKLSKKAQKQKDEEIAKLAAERKLREEQEEQAMLKEQQKQPEPEQSKEELKRLKSNLKMRIKVWLRKGKDVTELEAELAELNRKLESKKTPKPTKKNLDKKSSQKQHLEEHIQEISQKATKVSAKEKSSVKSKINTSTDCIKSKISKSPKGDVKSKKTSSQKKIKSAENNS